MIIIFERQEKHEVNPTASPAFCHRTLSCCSSGWGESKWSCSLLHEGDREWSSRLLNGLEFVRQSTREKGTALREIPRCLGIQWRSLPQSWAAHEPSKTTKPSNTHLLWACKLTSDTSSHSGVLGVVTVRPCRNLSLSVDVPKRPLWALKP